MNQSKWMVAMLAAVMASGCSSIVSKSDYPVSLDSTPSGAAYVLTNSKGVRVDSGVTPATVTLPSSAGYFQGEKYTLSVSMQGYSSRDYTFTASLDGWYFGNLLFGGLPGMLIVDPLTGAMFNLPEHVHVPLDASNNNKGQVVKIGFMEDLTPAEKQRLVPITAQ